MRRFFFSLTSLFLAGSLAAEPVSSEALGYFLDLPTNVRFLDIQDGGRSLALVNERGTVHLFLKARPLNGTLDRMLAADREQLQARGEEAYFFYNAEPAWLALWSLPSDAGTLEGFFLYVERGGTVYRLAAVTQEGRVQAYQDFLLSFLDSFAPTMEERWLPGPVSQFSVAYPPASPPTDFRHGYLLLPRAVNVTAAEAEQLVIEREARLLQGYSGGDGATIARAWSRFYRMIYREVRPRTQAFADSYRNELISRGVPQEDWPKTLLALLQGFEYQRRGGFSDIDASQTVLVRKAGDCDSLALLYLAVLDHWGVRGILMVSRAYAHAMAALDVPGQGARFSFDGKNWLAAELTAQVALGQIDSTRADPRFWLGIDLKKYP